MLRQCHHDSTDLDDHALSKRDIVHVDTRLRTFEGTLSMESTSVELAGFSALSVAALWGFYGRWPISATGYPGVHNLHHWSYGTEISVLQLVYSISTHHKGITPTFGQWKGCPSCSYFASFHQLHGFAMQSGRYDPSLAWTLRSLSSGWPGEQQPHFVIWSPHRWTKP